MLYIKSHRLKILQLLLEIHISRATLTPLFIALINQRSNQKQSELKLAL